MDQVVAAITQFITWLQLPAVVCFALALLVGGYELLVIGGERGSATAKKLFITSTIAFIIIKGASALASSFGSKINF